MGKKKRTIIIFVVVIILISGYNSGTDGQGFRDHSDAKS